MNVFRHELRAYRRSVIIWSLSMAVLAILYILIYKALGNEIEQFKVFIDKFPDVMKKAMNILVDNISTLVGFYSFIFTFVVLCGAIQAMNLGAGIVSKEIRDKTADFLMTKPVSRFTILTSKLLAVFVSLVITNLIYLGLTMLSAVVIVGEYDAVRFLMISLTLFFTQVVFMAMGIIISVLATKIRSVISVSLSTVFGFYIIGSLGAVIGDEKVRYLSPFRFFDLGYIIKNSSYEVSYCIVALLFIAAAIAASYMVYLKKDVHAV